MEKSAKGGWTSCLKKTDIYATSIGPTYNGLKTYPTTYGGCLSILSYIVILGWLVFQLLLVFLWSGTISLTTSPIDPDNLGNPLWNITSQQMIIANSIYSFNDTVFPEPYDQYLSTLYI